MGSANERRRYNIATVRSYGKKRVHEYLGKSKTQFEMRHKGNEKQGIDKSLYIKKSKNSDVFTHFLFIHITDLWWLPAPGTMK